MTGFSDDLERDDFYKKAISPDFPNHMQFVLEVPPEHQKPNLSFSMEGIDALSAQITDFIMARILATWNETGVPPHELIANLDLGFTAPKLESLRESFWPWWRLDDKGETILEGSYRVSPEQKP